MRIQEIALKNFRSYREASAALGPGVNLIGGLNYAGKSSLLDAISVALTGTCRGAFTGMSLSELRGDDKGKWVVRLETDQGSLERRDGEGPRAQAQRVVETKLGISGPVIRACLYAGEILRLDPKQAQQLVLDLTSDDKIRLEEDVRVLLARIGESPEAVSLSDIERLYKDAYQKRRAAGQGLKKIGAPEPPEAPKELEGSKTLDPDVIENQVCQPIRDAVEKLERQAREADQEVARFESAPDKARHRLESLNDEMERYAVELDGLRSLEDIQKEAESVSAKLKAIEKTGSASSDAYREREQQVIRATDQHNAVAIRLRRFEELGEQCPMCLGKVAKSRREKVLRELTAKKKAARQAVDAAQKALDTTPNPTTEDTGPLVRRLAELEQEEAHRAEVFKRVDTLEHDVSTAGSQLLRAQRDAEAVVEKQKEAAAAMRERIQEGRRRIEVIASYIGALREHRKALDMLEVAVEEHSTLKALCGLLGPDGPLRAEIAGRGGPAAFEAAVNESLKPMGFDVDLAPLLSLEDDPHVNGRPARMLSSSEQIRFGMAFQIAVARACGLGLVVVDNFDWLDAPGRNEAFPVLQDCGLQVIILMTVKGTTEEFRRVAAQKNAEGAWRWLCIEKGKDGSTIEVPESRERRATG